MLNNLLPDCSLLTTGHSLCLPKSCTTYTVKASDSCESIAYNNGITVNNLRSYNPTINPTCTNLNTTDGSVVCISNPDGVYLPPPPQNSTGINGEYADKVVSPPGPTPFGTTDQCGDYYQVQVADTCGHISVANGVSLDLFELINPSIDKSCDNLVTGLWYCVHPVYRWNATSTGGSGTGSSTTVAPPASTPPGTTSQCFAWHVVASGDTCTLLTATLGVTMAQLVAWNPNLKADCSNLLLGDAYCIRGPTIGGSSTTASQTSKTSSAAPTKTSSAAPTRTSSSSTTGSSGGGCSQTYTVVSGDSCFAIWTEFGLTEAQLRALNPSLDANCDLSIGQILCVRGSTTSTPTKTILVVFNCNRRFWQWNV